ncbi:MAG: hypothetical protein FWH34_03280 [Desulfovibrionaceae bacterium]|nr:hypothetical protein [Desulfovibrionaceae bacterium]
MAVSGIHNYGLDSYQMQQLFTQENKNTAADAVKTSAANYSAAQTVNAVAELTRAVMEKMGVGKNDRVSFRQINAYREQIEQEYAEQLRKDFALLGVDPKISFQLKENDKGGLTVGSEHPDKDKVQKYFDEHPELVEKFKEIQILANLEAARTQMDIHPAELKKRLQIENMSAWWNAEGDSGSIMSSSSAGTSWFSGLDVTV